MALNQVLLTMAGQWKALLHACFPSVIIIVISASSLAPTPARFLALALHGLADEGRHDLSSHSSASASLLFILTHSLFLFTEYYLYRIRLYG